MALEGAVNQILQATPEEIAAEVARLTEERNQIDQVIRTLSKLLPKEMQPAKPGPKPEAGGSKGLASEVKDQIAALYEEGADSREIAETLGLSAGKVSQSIKGMQRFGRLKEAG